MLRVISPYQIASPRRGLTESHGACYGGSGRLNASLGGSLRINTLLAPECLVASSDGKCHRHCLLRYRSLPPMRDSVRRECWFITLERPRRVCFNKDPGKPV